MNKFLQSFSNKKFRYGTFSTLTALFVIAIIVIMNLVIAQFRISADLSSSKMYSISDESKEILSELTEDVTIYALFKTGQESYNFKEILEQYAANSSRIKLVYKDPILYPQFVESYATEGQTIPVDSIIIETAKRNQVIMADDLLSYEFNYESMSTYVKSIDIEPQVTNAIRNLTMENTPKVYVVTGHNEVALPDAIRKHFTLLNNELIDFDLLDKTEIPADCSALIATTPQRDWTEQEAEIVRKYLQTGGCAMFLVDNKTEPFVNLEGVLTTYGIQLTHSTIIEGNSSNYFQGMPTYISPNYVQHDIMKKIIEKGYRMITTFAQGVQKTDIVKNTLKFEPLLTTSRDAFGRVDISNTSRNFEEGDIKGPFNVAVAVSDVYYISANQFYTKLVVIGTTEILNEYVNSYVGGTNYDFLSNSLNWLQGDVEKVYISPKSEQYQSLVIDTGQGLIIMLVTVIILPILIFGAGIIVWLRRRHS